MSRKLTDTAIETLKQIAETPRITTKSGYGEYVSGRSAWALVDRGLAKWVRIPGEIDLRVQITDAGREVLNGVSK